MCVCNVQYNIYRLTNVYRLECFRNYRMRSARCWSLGTWSWTRSRTCVTSRRPARSRARGRRASVPGRAVGSQGCVSVGSCRARRPDGSPEVEPGPEAVDLGASGWWPRQGRHRVAGATVTGRARRAANRRPPRRWAPCRTAVSARRARTAARRVRGRR